MNPSTVNLTRRNGQGTGGRGSNATQRERKKEREKERGKERKKGKNERKKEREKEREKKRKKERQIWQEKVLQINKQITDESGTCLKPSNRFLMNQKTVNFYENHRGFTTFRNGACEAY